MKRKTLGRSNRREKTKTKRMKGSLAGHLTVQQLGQVSFMPLQQQSSSLSLSNQSRFQTLPDSEAQAAESQIPSSSPLDINDNTDEKDFILSQDFFCTPDYITPDGQYILNGLDCNKENIPCPKSPEKLTAKSKRQSQEGISVNFLSSNLSCHEQVIELAKDPFGTDEIKTEKTMGIDPQKNHSYVSQSAVALRCRVMPPPCIKNPYLKDASEDDLDPFSNKRSKCSGIFPNIIGGDGLSRYCTDFHEIEQIGNGNFSRVFKVLKRIDGCFYAVKRGTRLLHQDTERRKALMEVQALAAIGSHENIVGYYSSWFENEQLFIQMELCDHSLSVGKSSKLFTERDVLEIMHQTMFGTSFHNDPWLSEDSIFHSNTRVCALNHATENKVGKILIVAECSTSFCQEISKALQCIHERGIAHLDVKPDNIYVKDRVYKLGDFGCATLLDRSLPIEEGDARYMPQEILNDKYDHLDKVDIFSVGAAIYELIRGSALPESGPLSLNFREGKLPLLPGHSVQFQNLLKAMIDPDPVRRPSAKELVENPIFEKAQRTAP